MYSDPMFGVDELFNTKTAKNMRKSDGVDISDGLINLNLKSMSG